MSDLLGIGLVILAICLFFSRSISKEALELLSAREKLRLNREFSRSGRFYPIPVLAGFAGYMAITYVRPSFSDPTFVVFIVFFLFSLVFTSIRVIGRMKASGFPEAYIREYIQSRWIYNFGFVLCGGILIYELLKS